MSSKKRYPVLPPSIGKVAKQKVVRRYEDWKIKDEIRVAQNNDKIVVLQLLESGKGPKELRLAYYIIGKRKRVKGKWVWGQFCTILPKATFRKVIKKAMKKGWV